MLKSCMLKDKNHDKPLEEDGCLTAPDAMHS